MLTSRIKEVAADASGTDSGRFMMYSFEKDGLLTVLLKTMSMAWIRKGSPTISMYTGSEKLIFSYLNKSHNARNTRLGKIRSSENPEPGQLQKKYLNWYGDMDSNN